MSTYLKPKLLVTGISGFLGNCVAGMNQGDWSIFGVYHKNPVYHANIKTIQADLCKNEVIENLFHTIQPDAVLHLAALSDPNYCELNPVASLEINVSTSLQIARFCKQYAIPMVYTSTDLVFDGKQAPYDEKSVPRPISLYGKHKLKAEEELMTLYPEVCIARLPVMFGFPKWGNSFMKSWINNLKEHKKIFAFTDEIRTTVSGDTAVEGLFLLLEKEVSGIWHLGGRERISRYNFAVLMSEIFDLPQQLVQPSKQADVQMPAARPQDVSLDSSKAFALGYNPPGLKESLEKTRNFALG